MRTTLNIDEALLERVMKGAGFTTKTAAIEAGLRVLEEKVARERLVKLYGSDPNAWAPSRERNIK